MIVLIIIFLCVSSSALYLYLHKKTHISLSCLYKDNLLNIVLTAIIVWLLYGKVTFFWLFLSIFVAVPTLCIILTIIRFYRVPLYKPIISDEHIISPADGNVIYIKRLDRGTVPIAVKNGVTATLNEFVNTNLLDSPCWLVGINMTPFDIHKNCAPISGTILLNHHTDGEFLSLKHPDALRRNERNSIIIENSKGRVGVVQTASHLVRRIVTYKQSGDFIKQGDWFGMIKFGSQVDLIIPACCDILIHEKQQVYVGKTAIAIWNHECLD